MTGGGNLVRYERYRKSPRATKSAHARYYYTRSLVLDSPVKRRARSTSSPNRNARCHSAPKIMDSHSRSASPREAQRPQIRPPSPPSSPSPTGFDNRAYQHDEDPNHNQSFTSNGTSHQNGHKQNGDTKLEAVNLELINLTPKNASKKDAVDINASNPYDEYFVPVNEHRKFMRGEKLYVTADKRGEKSSCKRPLCWTLLVLVVAAIVAVIVLAATGILFSGHPTALNPYNGTVSSARAFGSVISDQDHTPNEQNSHDHSGQDHSGHDHSAHDHSGHDHSSHDHSMHDHSDHDETGQDTATDNQHGPETEPQDDADKMVDDESDMSMYVPRTLEGTLVVDNEEYTSELEDPDSNQYRDFVDVITHGLKRALFNRTLIDSGNNDIAIEVIKLREGSVEVTYRIHWKPKNENANENNPGNDLLTTRTLMNKLNNYLEKNNRMINIYHISENNVKVKPVLDICQVDNNQCDHGCEFDESILDFACTCPHGQMIDMNNNKRCIPILDNAESDATDSDDNVTMVNSVQSTHTPVIEDTLNEPVFNATFDWKETNHEAQPTTESETDVNFSHIFGQSDHKYQPEAVAEPTSEPEPTAEPKAEPEPTAELIAELETTAQPKAEPEPTAEPKAEPKPMAEFTAELEEPTAEPKAEPEPTTEPKAEPEPTAEPKAEPEPTAEPTSEPEPTAEPKPEPEPTAEPKAEPEPTAEPKAEPEPTAESKAEPEPTAEPKAEPEQTAQPKAEPEPTAEPKPESESTADPKSEPEPTTEFKVGLDIMEEHKAEPEPTAEPKAEPEPSGPAADPEHTAKPAAELGAPPKTTESASEPELTDSESSDLENKYHIVTMTTLEPETTVETQFEYKMKTETITIPKPTLKPKSTRTGDIDFDFDLHPSSDTESTTEAESTLVAELMSATEQSTTEEVSTLGMHSENSDFLQISDFMNKNSNANISQERETTPEQISVPTRNGSSNYDPSTDFISFFGKHSNIEEIMAEDDEKVETTETAKTTETTDFNDWLEDTISQKENQENSKIEGNDRSKIFDMSFKEQTTTIKVEINQNDNVNQTISNILVNENSIPEEIFTNAPIENNEDTTTTTTNSVNDESEKELNSERISTSRTEIPLVDIIEKSEKLLKYITNSTTEEPNSERQYSILEQRSGNKEEQQLINALTTKDNVKRNETQKPTENNKQDDVTDITFDVINNNLFNRSSKSIENRTNDSKANESLSNFNDKVTSTDSDWLSEPVTELNYEDEIKNHNPMTTEIITKVDEILNDARSKDDFEPDYLLTPSHNKMNEHEMPSYGMGLDYVDDDSRVKRVNTDAPFKTVLNEESKEKESVTKIYVPIEVTTVSDYIYKSADKIANPANETTSTEESVPAPVWEENERDLKVKDVLQSTDIPKTTTARIMSVGDIVLPLEVSTTTTIAPESQTTHSTTTFKADISSRVRTDSSGVGEFNNLNVTIYEIPNHNSSKGTKDAQIPDFEDHETEMNPFLPEVENNKILVKKLQEGHDIEPNNLTEIQNENNDEHNNVSEVTTHRTDTDEKNVETLLLQPANTSTTEDFTSFHYLMKSQVNNTKNYTRESAEKAKKILPISTFIQDTDDLDVIREPTTERKASISDNNFEGGVVTESPSQVSDDNLRVVPIQELSLGALKTYSSESMQELNDISDSPKKSARTLEETKFHSVLNNEA